MAQPGLTLEVYLGAAADPDVTVDFGSSDFYTKEELDAAALQVKCKFASFAGCELHSLRYAGDQCNSEESTAWANKLKKNMQGQSLPSGLPLFLCSLTCLAVNTGAAPIKTVIPELHS